MALGMDPLAAEVRQAVFFDTPDLALDRAGLVVRARRVTKGGDIVVKLRPVEPSTLPKKLRENPGFGVEVDAMPGEDRLLGHAQGSGRQRGDQPRHGGQALAGEAPDPRAAGAVHGVRTGRLNLESLIPLGPINLIKLKFVPRGYPRRMVAEMWFFPNGARILELSTKCMPAEAGQTLTTTRELLDAHGVSLTGTQETKTRSALNFFSKLAAARAEKDAAEATA